MCQAQKRAPFPASSKFTQRAFGVLVGTTATRCGQQHSASIGESPWFWCCSEQSRYLFLVGKPPFYDKVDTGITLLYAGHVEIGGPRSNMCLFARCSVTDIKPHEHQTPAAFPDSQCLFRCCHKLALLQKRGGRDAFAPQVQPQVLHRHPLNLFPAHRSHIAGGLRSPPPQQ